MSPILLDCTKSQFLKLERIQYKCLRIALGAMNSTPNLALEQLGNLMPFRERFSFFANNIANQRRCSSFSKYYTDGSKSQSAVSCAVRHPEAQSSAAFTLHSESSIYTAEPYAIYKTTLKTFSHDSNTTKYLILSDSKSALKALSSYSKSSNI